MRTVQDAKVPTLYEEYLQSDQFDEIRQKVFERDGWECVICGSSEILQAHHLTYKNVYHEELQDLITLCRNCHTIYHIIERKRQLVEKLYEQEESVNLRVPDWLDKEQKEREESTRIEIEIKDEYLSQDYCKGGCLDLMDWTILNKIIDKKCKEHGIEFYRGRKTELRDFFLYRRCEFLLRCIEQNKSFQTVLNGTNFSFQWLSRWYRKDRCEAKLKEEELLKGGL